MKRGILTLAAAATMTINPLFACGQDGHDGFLPENDMWIGTNVKSAGGITESVFNEVLDRVEDIYAPIISARGKKMVVERNWSDGTVNAYARQTGNNWQISMFGGLARHEAITADGLHSLLVTKQDITLVENLRRSHGGHQVGLQMKDSLITLVL